MKVALSPTGLPRDELGRVVGFAMPNEAARVQSIAKREREEERAFLRRFAKKRRPPTRIDWSAVVGLGERSDTEIARELGVRREVVSTARKRLGVASPRELRRWTRGEDRRLRDHFDVARFGALEDLARTLNRTPEAVRRRMVVLGLAMRGRARWPKVLHRLCVEWGYDERRVVTAAARAGAEIERIGGRLFVSQEAASAIRAELAKHPDGGRLHGRRVREWGPGETCKKCGSAERTRASLGLCSRCYKACSGFGDLHSRALHGMSCWEVACELRYLPAGFPWEHVVEVYRRRGESLDGRARAGTRHGW